MARLNLLIKLVGHILSTDLYMASSVLICVSLAGKYNDDPPPSLMCLFMQELSNIDLFRNRPCYCFLSLQMRGLYQQLSHEEKKRVLLLACLRRSISTLSITHVTA